MKEADTRKGRNRILWAQEESRILGDDQWVMLGLGKRNGGNNCDLGYC